jgi:hypothetical protein
MRAIKTDHHDLALLYQVKNKQKRKHTRASLSFYSPLLGIGYYVVAIHIVPLLYRTFFMQQAT